MPREWQDGDLASVCHVLSKQLSKQSVATYLLAFFLFFSPGFCLHVCCFSGEHSCSVSALNTRLSKYPGCVHADQFMLLMVGGDQSAYSLVLIHVLDIKKKAFLKLL